MSKLDKKLDSLEKTLIQREHDILEIKKEYELNEFRYQELIITMQEDVFHCQKKIAELENIIQKQNIFLSQIKFSSINKKVITSFVLGGLLTYIFIKK